MNGEPLRMDVYPLQGCWDRASCRLHRACWPRSRQVLDVKLSILRKVDRNTYVNLAVPLRSALPVNAVGPERFSRCAHAGARAESSPDWSHTRLRPR